jgi:cysteine-rich repeat protein
MGDNDGNCEAGETCVCAAEQCDDGDNNNTNACTNRCLTPVCGDGIVTPSGAVAGPGDNEECDDGNNVNTDSCTSGCRWNTCGDGVRYLTDTDDGNNNALEECDNGHDYPGADPDLYTEGPAGLNNAGRDDGYFDEAFFCSDACQIQCTNSAARGSLYKDDTACIFIAEGDDELDDADSTYQAFSVGWDAAQQHCEDYGIGAHLVTMRLDGTDGSDDNDDLEDLVAGVGQSFVWLGLTDREDEGTWVWLDANRPLWDEDPGTDWSLWDDPNEPSGGNPDCAAFDADTADIGLWYDENCNTNHAVVCEFPL